MTDIKILRELVGVKQKDLAIVLGIDKGRLSNFENGLTTSKI